MMLACDIARGGEGGQETEQAPGERDVHQLAADTGQISKLLC